MRTFLLEYDSFDPDEEGLREALCTLGNGYFATRGAADEAVADDVHYPGTYLAGGYNRLTTEMAGRKIENEDLVNLPNWLLLRFRMAGENWFDLGSAEILSYRQKLDIQKGVLYREYTFRDGEKRETTVSSRRLVHMKHAHLAAQEMTITAENWSGPLEISSALDGRVVNNGVERYKKLNNRHLEPLEEKQVDDDTIFLKVQTRQSEIRIAQAARTRVYRENQRFFLDRNTLKDQGYIAQLFVLDLEERLAVTVEKTVSLFTSKDYAIADCSIEAKKALRHAGSFDELMVSHDLAWKHLWQRFDVKYQHSEEREGDRTGLILHLYIFHLLQTTSMHTMDLDVGVPSRGWHGEAYRGHIFWDELFIFPLLNYRLPEITRSLLMYRYRRLDEARRAARRAGYRGAMFPWQSASNGREESQMVHLNPQSGRWIPDNSHLQRHVSTAIVYNLWQYYEITADMEFLSSYGAEMLLEIARFWASISTYNSYLDRYEINGVMGPDEYHDAYPDSDRNGLDNNAYTNVMACWIFTKAFKLMEMLPEERVGQLKEKMDLENDEIDNWQEISRKMRIVFHGDGIISQFEGYDELEEFDWEKYRKKYGDIQRLDRILESEGDTPNRYKLSKQADVLMLFYLFSSEKLAELFEQLGYSFDPEIIPKNIRYYLKRTSHGSTLSRVVHSWVLSRSDRAGSWKLFSEALKSDIEDIQGGTTPEGIHLGAMAGTVDLITRCYTGLEVRDDVLHLNPYLPEEVGKLHMHVRYRGHSLQVDIIDNTLKIRAQQTFKASIRIGYDGKMFELVSGETREVDF
jgi:alpha,alpha-trehalase